MMLIGVTEQGFKFEQHKIMYQVTHLVFGLKVLLIAIILTIYKRLFKVKFRRNAIKIQ